MNATDYMTITVACAVVTISLLLFAWRYRHRDHLLRKVFRTKPCPPPVSCLNCIAGIADMEKTTITGTWNCPSCGRPHSFVDGVPGVIEPFQ